MSPFGIRSLSAAYRDGATVALDGRDLAIRYVPGESEDGMFGGNSNWRGPVWYPVNVLLTDALRAEGWTPPERFRAVLAAVPFVDALTTILRPDLPLTVGEWDEWGNPLEDPAVYAYMRSYSPYEGVQPVEYPAILATTSLNDSRVYYVEPAKWIAKLREVGRGGPFLLKTEMSAGHGGVSGRYAKWKQTAFEYAWTIRTAGAG